MTASTPDRGTVLAALELAGRAPSLHNSQPWRWLLADHSVHLYADGTRRVPIADPTGRELVISCGAALHHARVAFASLGWRTFVHRLPNPADGDHLAALEFVPHRQPPEPALAMAGAITARHTDRRPFLPDPVPPAVLRTLVSAAAAEHATLTVAGSDAARRELVLAMTMVDRAQRDDSAYRTELAVWAGRGPGAVDGVPAGSLRSGGPTGRPMLARDFSTAGDGRLTAPPMDDGAVLAVLSTGMDDHRRWLAAGEALSAVLLGATAAGLASCTLSQIAETRSARDAVRAALGRAGEPQLLVRLGWPVTERFPGNRTPRRPVTEATTRWPDTG
jgi:hypothetical protein